MAGTPELEGADKDDLLLLSEIFNASSLEEGEFSKEWAAVFGDGRLKEPAPTAALGEPDPRPQAGSGFLPSQLLDQNIKDLQASLEGTDQRDCNGAAGVGRWWWYIVCFLIQRPIFLYLLFCVFWVLSYIQCRLFFVLFLFFYSMSIDFSWSFGITF